MNELERIEYSNFKWREIELIMGDDRFTPAERLGLARLFMHQNRNTGDTFPAYGLVGAEIGVDEETIGRAVRKARKLGRVTTEKVDGRETLDVTFHFAAAEDEIERKTGERIRKHRSTMAAKKKKRQDRRRRKYEALKRAREMRDDVPTNEPERSDNSPDTFRHSEEKRSYACVGVTHYSETPDRTHSLSARETVAIGKEDRRKAESVSENRSTEGTIRTGQH